jgi:hypothetical protein
MSRSRNWIFCESTGRWAAAMRTALERRQFGVTGKLKMPRIQEVRSQADLEAAIGANRETLGFVEVSDKNLAAVLDMLARYMRRNSRLVGLLEVTSERQAAAEALTEAGALCVASAPRNIAAVIDVAEQYCDLRTRGGTPAAAESIADLAWAALPWQDA